MKRGKPWLWTSSSATARWSTARGCARYRADVGIVGGRIATIGRIRERGARGDRRRGPRRHARLHRRPHPHGRAGVLGSARHVLVLARRHHRGHGQLRLHPGARPGPTHASSCVRNLERAEDIVPPRRCAAGIEWTLGDVRRVPRRASTALPKGINYAGNIGHSRAAHLGDGRAGLRRSRQRRRPRRDGARAASGARGRRRRVHHVALASTTRPPTTGPSPSRMADWDEVCALVDVHGRARRRHVRDRPRAMPDSDSRRPFLDRLENLAVDTGCPSRSSPRRPPRCRTFTVICFRCSIAQPRVAGCSDRRTGANSCRSPASR